MSTERNPWDTLAATVLNTNVAAEDVDSNAADNIIISWPVIIDCIQQQVTSGPDTRALDFGCGTGSFSRKLHELGFSVVGVDSSKAMIQSATQSHGDVAEFKIGDATVVSSLGMFSVISSLMTLQFIEDAEKTISSLAAALEPEGLLIFSVFTREYAKNASEVGREFFDFNFAKNPSNGYLELAEDDKVPTYIRDADYYTHIATGYGLHPILQSSPPFTEDFLRDYPHPVPTDDPEYMILGFKK